MPIAYYGVCLSDNIVETDEGYLICRNAVIGRTGAQKYKGKELDPDDLEKQQIDIGPEDLLTVYRDADEVFAPSTLASFEGKPVTDGHPTGADGKPFNLDIETHADHHCGHIQNIHKGAEPLDTGDWPMRGDIIVTDPGLKRKIQAGLRELSCGYTYHLLKDGNRITQVDICGNHVAVVPNGRAGAGARIHDAAPVENQPPQTQEKRRMKLSEITPRYLLGLALKQLAADGTPEELAHAARIAHDADPEKKDDEPKDKPKDKPKAADSDEVRSRMHAALDSVLDGKEAQANEANEDMEALKKLLAGDPGSPETADAAPKDDESEAADAEDDEDDAEAADEGADPSVVVSPEDRPKPTPGAGTDARAAADSGAAVLKALKPFVARSKDKQLMKAFDTASALVNARAPRANRGSYAGAVNAARSTAADAGAEKTPAQKAAELNSRYAKYRGKIPSEVK